MTHDYKRHGTTTLFAALDVLTGKVIGKCFARHRHDEFLRFLRTIDTSVPRKLQIHLIVDNYEEVVRAGQRGLMRRAHKSVRMHAALRAGRLH
jgi:hypothetical protein